MNPMFEVAVVGGGVVGCAVARLLALHDCSVVLLEAGTDIGAGTSKANTAILHTGFDATPGTLESRLVARGYELLSAYAPTVGVSIEKVGAVLVAWTDEQAQALPSLITKAQSNGYNRANIIDSNTVYDLEPHLGPGVVAGLVVPDEHIIDPWSTPIAFATEAVANGAVIMRNFPVTRVHVGAEYTELQTADGQMILARYVVNSAGLYGDEVHRQFGFDGFTIVPRRGELIVFDKFARSLVNRTILPVPTAHTKGVLVAPTVFGNVMLGPTADNIDDKRATGSTKAGIAALIDKGRRIFPGLMNEEVTAVYAGLRAATEHSDYHLSSDAAARYVCLGGIRSTGLTSSMALAEETVIFLSACDFMPKRSDEVAKITLIPLGEVDDRPYQSGGRIVCHCERVTASEIAGAVTSSVPAVSFDGLRRRTRATAGRCQGFYCTAEICSLTGLQS